MLLAILYFGRGAWPGWQVVFIGFLIGGLFTFLSAWSDLELLPAHYQFSDGALIATDREGKQRRYERWVRVHVLGAHLIHAQNATDTICVPEAAYAPASPITKASAGLPKG